MGSVIDAEGKSRNRLANKMGEGEKNVLFKCFARNRNRRKSRKHLVHESAISKSIDERNMYTTKKRGQLDKWTRITNLLETCVFLIFK